MTRPSTAPRSTARLPTSSAPRRSMRLPPTRKPGISDDAYGMIRWKQATDGFADFGMTFGNPDFVAFARAHHAGGTRVETPEGLVPALERAFQVGGVQLVAVPIDYSENTRVLVDELRKHA